MDNHLGWTPNPKETDALVASLPVAYGFDAGTVREAFDESKPHFSWRVAAACLKGSAWLAEDGRIKGRSQGSFGSCCGFGCAGAVLITAAGDVIRRKERESYPTDKAGAPVRPAPAWYYGASRHISGNLGSWQGSYGGSLAKAVREWGCLFELPYSTSLSVYQIAQCREWQRRGVPDDLIRKSKEHRMRAVWRCKDWRDVAAFIAQDYGVFFCAPFVPDGRRDRDGVMRKGSSGGHCVNLSGYCPKRGFFYDNSHGDNYGRGGVWPQDMPRSGGWVARATIDKHVRGSRDTFALGGFDGFRLTEPNWEWVGW